MSPKYLGGFAIFVDGFAFFFLIGWLSRSRKRTNYEPKRKKRKEKKKERKEKKKERSNSKN